MNILLIGEFSRLHNSLKEGLLELGHHVVICGLKDGFKDYPVDFPIYKKWDSGFLKKIKIALYRLTGFDVSSWLTYRQFLRYNDELKGFDVVQLINENSFYCQPNFEQKILKNLFKNNKKTFLLSCGDDYMNVKFAFANREMKSAIQPYFSGKIASKDFIGVLKYHRPDFKALHDFIYENISGVIASDLDYEPALLGHSKYLGLIANPVNTKKIEFNPFTVEEKIVIFLGINQLNYFKKGIDFFENALEIIKQDYGSNVEILIARNIPYAQYISLYDRAHIVLDQVYAIDQGYNALEAMAKGKVVFTGAEQQFIKRYKITERVNVNAVPDVDELVRELSHLVRNPSELVAIGQRARTFIEHEHDYIAIAQRYVSMWNATEIGHKKIRTAK